MFLEAGENVHVIERRLFEGDVRRHFVGEVQGADVMAMRVRGFVFVHDTTSSTWIRGSERRTRIIPIGSSGFVINVLSRDTHIDDVRYEEIDGRLIVTDGGTLNLDINEFGRMR
ncbi:MAG: hypothetical protein OEQ47_01515 [Acidimicrobiia bacterium]|nr:hypothetical protein [Acidimicrobiia bacterium]